MDAYKGEGAFTYEIKVRCLSWLFSDITGGLVMAILLKANFHEVFVYS